MKVSSAPAVRVDVDTIDDYLPHSVWVKPGVFDAFEHEAPEGSDEQPALATSVSRAGRNLTNFTQQAERFQSAEREKVEGMPNAEIELRETQRACDASPSRGNNAGDQFAIDLQSRTEEMRRMHKKDHLPAKIVRRFT